MLKYQEVVDYLNYEYPYIEDVFGLFVDLVNGVTDLEPLKKEIKEYKEHNQ